MCRPEYRYPEEKCKLGCGQIYRESEEEHFRCYQQVKTVALVCGCGFGDIMANRFRVHLKKVHNEDYTLDEVVENFFFHKLPAFTTVKPCTNPRYKDTCMLRSPYASIVSSKHQCLRDMQYTKIVKPTEHFKLLHPSQVPVWGLPGEDKLKEEGPGTRAPVRRKQPLERRPQRDPQRERANAAVRSRVLEQPQRDRRQPTTEEDERRIIRELASDLDIRRKRLEQHKLTVSPTRPQQEVSPTRRSAHESRSV